jgi:hypothetical protein
MKLFSLTTLAAALVLSVPMMASAATLKGNTADDSIAFTLGSLSDDKETDKIYNYYKLSSVPSDTYKVIIDLTWKDMTYRQIDADLSTTKVNALSKMTLDFDGTDLWNSYTAQNIGTNKIEYTFSNLSKGDYEFSASAIWKSVTGKVGSTWDWRTTKGTLDMTLKSVALTTPVPEPESYAMLLAGLGLIGTIVARSRKSLEKV